ncbi:MAG: hypothetical protein AAB403_19985 [Planctomycetota bacterium]
MPLNIDPELSITQRDDGTLAFYLTITIPLACSYFFRRTGIPEMPLYFIKVRLPQMPISAEADERCPRCHKNRWLRMIEDRFLWCLNCNQLVKMTMGSWIDRAPDGSQADVVVYKNTFLTLALANHFMHRVSEVISAATADHSSSPRDRLGLQEVDAWDLQVVERHLAEGGDGKENSAYWQAVFTRMVMHLYRDWNSAPRVLFFLCLAFSRGFAQEQPERLSVDLCRVLCEEWARLFEPSPASRNRASIWKDTLIDHSLLPRHHAVHLGTIWAGVRGIALKT